jgi:muramidase (phage lysozyme)
MGGPSISGGGSIGSSGSREAGIAADRNSVSGYSGSGGSITAAGSRAAGVAADRNSVSGYSGSGLYSSAGQTPSFREAEIASMAAYDRYRTTDLAAQHRASENKSMSDYALEKTLSTIRSAEAGVTNPYDRLVGGGPVDYADLRNMTVAEVMEYQKSMLANGHKSTAIGAYQTTKTTLGEMVAELGIPLDAKFDEATQDQIAKGLLDRRASQSIVDGALDVDRLANSLAKEWASFQTSDGRGYYDGDGLNHASVSHDVVRDLADGLAAYGIVGPGERTSTPPSQVANNGAFPNTTTAVPTTRASFGSKYLGDGLVEKAGFFPNDIGAVPTSRPSPVASAFTGRPDVPVGSLPAARMGTTVAGRPDVPVGSLPAARAATTIAGRPDVPVGALPAARDIPASNFPARPAGPATGLPAARFEDKYLAPQRPDNMAFGGPQGNFSVDRPAPLDAAPVGAVERGPSLAAPSPSRPDNFAASGPKGGFSVPAMDRSVSPATPGELGGIAMSNPTGLGGPGGLYVGGQPAPQDDRIAKGRADETAYSAFEANRAAGFSQIADRPKSTSQQIGEGLFGDEDTYVDDETVPIADLPEHPSAPRPSAPVGPAATPAKKEDDDSIAEVVVAGGLDILGGMVPVFGTGLSVVNAGLAITGNKTVGQRIADYIFDGDNQYQPGQGTQRTERGDGTASEWFKSERFAKKYLRAEPEEPETQVGSGWVETTGRPTPKQRYIDNRDNYAG